MTRHGSTLGKSYFDTIYAGDDDPWRFETSDYERAKYHATIAALPRAHYRSGLEAGCSIGVLTRRIAPFCAQLLAFDVSDKPLQRARDACADLPQVAFAQIDIPAAWPRGSFDLMIFSEVLYYQTRDDLARTAAAIDTSLAPGGDVLCVHWIRDTDYPLSGDDAMSFMLSATEAFLTPLRQTRTQDYRLDVLRRR